VGMRIAIRQTAVEALLIGDLRFRSEVTALA
jgi:hypothetical protein